MISLNEIFKYLSQIFKFHLKNDNQLNTFNQINDTFCSLSQV